MFFRCCKLQSGTAICYKDIMEFFNLFFDSNVHNVVENLFENVNVLMLMVKLKKGYKYIKNLQTLTYTSTVVILDTLKITWLHEKDLFLSDF